MDVNSVSGNSVSSHTSPPSSVQAPQRRLLFRDVETRGVLDLRKVGAHRYAADTATDVLPSLMRATISACRSGNPTTRRRLNSSKRRAIRAGWLFS